MPSTAFNYEIVEKVAVLSQSIKRSPKQPGRSMRGAGNMDKNIYQLAGEAAEEINRQAEETQRELQRIADEADKAIRGTL